MHEVHDELKITTFSTDMQFNNHNICTITGFQNLFIVNSGTFLLETTSLPYPFANLPLLLQRKREVSRSSIDCDAAFTKAATRSL